MGSPEMGSENAATLEASSAARDTSPPPCTKNCVLHIVESNDDDVINGDPMPAAVVETNGFLSNIDNSPGDNCDAVEPQAVNADVSSGDDGSGWLNTSLEGNSSGWISADGTPVVLQPASSEQPWPSSRRCTLYLVRIPRSVDEKLRNEIKLAEAKLEQTIKRRDVHKVALQEKKTSKAELLEKLKPIRERERACRDALQGKRMELEPFSLALNKFKSAQSNLRGKGQDICSSEEELNDKIAEIQYKMQHESIPLKEEKQLLRDIKQLESTRSQVCANSVLQAELMENLGPREEIHDQYKFLCQDMDSIKKEHKQARVEYDTIDKEIEKLNGVIEELRQQYEKANAAQQDAYAALRELKKQESLKNDMFYQNKRDIHVARELTTQKKLEDLEGFCTKKVEDFLAMWNNDAKFRAEYVKSNERSTVRRLETLDGRSLGPGEKPPQISEVEVLLPRPVIADSPAPATATAGRSKVSKAPSSGTQVLEMIDRVVVNEGLHGKHLPIDMKEDEDRDLLSTAINIKSIQIDAMEDSLDSEAQAAELKEKHRQEQMAKAKEAEERKKKRAEKLESKVQARAKKDVERKEKEREKKAQKKATATMPSSSGADIAPSNEESISVAAKPPVPIPEEGSKNAVNTVNKAQKGATGSRRKPSGKDLRALRPTLTKPFSSKKAVWPIPLWAFAIIALIVLLVALFLFLRL